LSAYRLGLPSDFKRRLQASLPAYSGVPVSVGDPVPRNRQERRCAAYEADHYEVRAFYTTVSRESLDMLEEALKAVPGVYATTQVRRASDRVTAPNVFTNPDWPPPLGTERRDRNDLRPQVLALIRDEEQPAERAEEAPNPSIFRCAECGDGARLRGWVHVSAHGPVGADGVIGHYEYESEDAAEIIEESITCEIHGEGAIEKLAGGQYTSAMVNGKFVAQWRQLTGAALDYRVHNQYQQPKPPPEKGDLR
jgi:hypothetical protein